MKNIRMVLYMALGAICISLWGAWQKDYPPVEVAKPTAASQTQIVLPSGLNNNNRTITPSENNISIAQQTAATSNIENRLVTIRTDVLDLAIDTIGGNIVQAKLLKYPVSMKQKNEPMQIMDNSVEKLYIAPSALISSSGPDKSFDHQAHYETAAHHYTLEQDQKELTVKLNWYGQNGLNVTKKFTFSRGKYDVKVVYDVLNQGNKPWTGDFVTALQRKSIPEDKGGGMFSFRAAFTGASISSPEKPYEKLSYDSLAKEPLARSIQGGWLALQQRYFLSAWIPDSTKNYNYFSQVLPDQIYTIGLADSVKVLPNEKTSFGATLYTGPEITDNLKTLSPTLDLTIDYGWLWWLSVGLFWLMQQIFKIVGNWGWSIIIVTILIKLVFYKFSEKSYHSMAKMRNLAPKFQALKDRYGEDKQKMSQATMELYKKEKVNPMGGCLPTLVQIPFFIALYYVLIGAVELRQAPFMFWIQDLADKDPYYILPILMGLSMFLQQRLNPTPPTADPMQAKMMMFLPVIFTVFFLSFPSGLVLYWLVNNCLSVAQQWYITWKVEKNKK